ncbi:MAG: M20/M25/M40 family metallo-hydrolase [Bacteroidia bacterium]|nr:M20/M25/M40 family metallo-hydrolase [Bacteroidia bacterium]
MNYELVKQMCAIHSPSGSEYNMTKFLLEYINNNKKNWKTEPQLFYGEDFQDCLVLVFGKPRTAIFAHIDTIGFTVRYGNQLVCIGKPVISNGYKLIGEDKKGAIQCKLKVHSHNQPEYESKRELERGTTLTFLPEWKENNNYIQCCYLDNRLGVFNALKVAETLKDGIICFSCWEETGGGSVEYLAKFIYEKYKVKQALISDITWVTEGVSHGNGCVVSLRDSGLPRKQYVNKIVNIIKESKLPFQLEVEATGGSDANSIQHSPYPINWCFVGAPESNVHSPKERAYKKDIESMIDIYKLLMEKL